ncbi:hypothetical protein BJV74DRAFT_338578 [Russula compacta]|nr:hypothetical protein BJV74DRAFT_338578 [Russula compacta]
MPFANLPTHEKDAFFALLDEYFTSRPDLLSRVGGAAGNSERADTETQSTPGSVPIPGAAITAAQRALANPATSRVLAAGLQRAASSNTGGSGHPSTASVAAAATAASSLSSSAHNAPVENANDRAPTVNVGRVAAAAQAFSSTSPAPASAAHKRADSSSGGLAPQKKFGDVDVSSAGAMFRSLRGSTAAKNAQPAPVHTPPAFSGRKASSGFAPPPVRRVTASSSPVPAPAPEPEEDVQPGWAGEEAGAWAEALFDYTSEEAGDLHLREGERVRVTEQTSSDWWTGEIDGRSGLFPASYVKLL